MSHPSLLIVAAALSLTAAQTPAPPADFAALTGRLEKAALNDDTQGVKDSRSAFLQMLAAAPAARTGAGAPTAALLHYTVAYADWRLAYSPTLTPAEQSGMLDDAVEQLERAMKLEPAFAEAHGLLSSIYGAQISKNPDLGATLGMAFGEVLGRALSLDPNSPRLLMARGVSLMHTPVEYGGDPKQGETVLRQALESFAKEPAGKAWPNWGLADTHLWLGQALAGRGDNEGARAEYKAALELAPGNGRAKGLLAQLK